MVFQRSRSDSCEQRCHLQSLVKNCCVFRPVPSPSSSSARLYDLHRNAIKDFGILGNKRMLLSLSDQLDLEFTVLRLTAATASLSAATASLAAAAGAAATASLSTATASLVVGAAATDACDRANTCSVAARAASHLGGHIAVLNIVRGASAAAAGALAFRNFRHAARNVTQAGKDGNDAKGQDDAGHDKDQDHQGKQKGHFHSKAHAESLTETSSHLLQSPTSQRWDGTQRFSQNVFDLCFELRVGVYGLNDLSIHLTLITLPPLFAVATANGNERRHAQERIHPQHGQHGTAITIGKGLSLCRVLRDFLQVLNGSSTLRRDDALFVGGMEAGILIRAAERQIRFGGHLFRVHFGQATCQTTASFISVFVGQNLMSDFSHLLRQILHTHRWFGCRLDLRKQTRQHAVKYQLGRHVIVGRREKRNRHGCFAVGSSTTLRQGSVHHLIQHGRNAHGMHEDHGWHFARSGLSRTTRTKFLNIRSTRRFDMVHGQLLVTHHDIFSYTRGGLRGTSTTNRKQLENKQMDGSWFLL